ncbi:MAG: TetR family transcriptional regulator [Propionibacteriales bacterium]|nr:TetR family transcriptional regulator [Propionibacteriales bacterium]
MLSTIWNLASASSYTFFVTGSATSGRPRDWDTDHVLDEALELFWRKGYRSTTTRELEASLGLSQSSIYNAFGSKAELLTAALDRYESRIDAALVAPLEASDRGLEAVDDFLTAVHRWITHDGRADAWSSTSWQKTAATIM